MLNVGSWSRHLVVLEHQVLKIPAGLPVEAAATVSVNPCTAFRLLKDFEDLEPGNPFKCLRFRSSNFSCINNK